MSSPAPALHVYAREIDVGERSSLSVLAPHIPAGARVLDLGCGSGAVGRHLAARDGAAAGPIDGLTISHDEAALAAAHYRRVEVADLDAGRLTEIFAPGSYDRIVCADVLEHTRHPDRVLAQCRALLADGGRALLSIPNAAYAGLLAELMAGEFRYRPEGLLDETHLRFFTRRSLLRFLQENGCAVDSVETVQRQLPDSEFRVAFDALPPAAARHLLALPDALSYQFIVVARPAAADEALVQPEPEVEPPAQALFSTQLYWDQGQGFAEDRRLVATGVIGRARQTLRFALPAGLAHLKRLKLDPADRPGILHLHALTLHASDAAHPLWHWSAHHDGAAALAHSAVSQQMVWGAQLPGAAVALLTGDDPWLQLPIDADRLTQAAAAGPLTLDVELGWPMSADYTQLASVVGPLEAEQRFLRAQVARIADITQDHEKLAVEHADLHRRHAFLFAERERQVRDLHEHLRGMDEHLRNLQSSRVFRYTRPLVKLHSLFFGRRGTAADTRADDGANPEPAPAPAPPPRSGVVDVIVPVYRGLADTKLCLESVLASPQAVALRLIVINDASPEPEVTQWLREKAAAEPRITLLENEHNLGFVGTVNRGMRHSDANDVLLLNSDTEVAGDWLDRLRACAYGHARTASVTPFSGNATICSYPVFCADNPLPEGQTTASLDRLFAQANAGQSVLVPTGVGFCMYIRRDCLDAVGLFDEANFGKGYGEENDFCQRAIGLGWHNRHALDTYVRHTGGVSFGDSKSPREQAAIETLRRLHPGYDAQVRRFVQRDPARPARLAVDWLLHTGAGRKPVILAVNHQRGGGTERHILELAELLADVALFVSLRPAGGHRVQLQLVEPDAGRWTISTRWSALFDLALEPEREALLQLLRTMPVAHIHYHHLLGHGKLVWALPEQLGVGYDVTLHDFYSTCTHITLTGKHGRYQMDAQGECCGGQHPRSLPELQEDIQAWRIRNRVLLHNARVVLAPSLDTALRMRRAVPEAPIRCAPHTDLDPATLPAPHPRALTGAQPLRIAVIGALSVIKGADVLEDVARLAKQAGAPLEFELLGYGYRHLQTAPATALTKVHGQYREADLPALLQRVAPDLVWFPAQWPETYSYTLSAALAAGLPVAVPDLGAFVERVADRPWSWVEPWDSSAQGWLDFFLRIRAQCFVAGHAPQAGPLPDALAALHASHPAWDYRADYLAFAHADASAQAVANAPAVARLVAAQQPVPPALAAGAGGAYALALKLQQLPVLGGLARRIPSSWRYRVKQLLSR